MKKGNSCGYLRISGRWAKIQQLSDKHDPIFTVIQKWTQYAARNPAKWYCPLKYVLVHFVYHEVYYVISPDDLQTNDNTFEHLVNGLIDDLVDLGCIDVFYGGMMD